LFPVSPRAIASKKRWVRKVAVYSFVVSPGTSLYGLDCHDTFSKMKHEEANVQRRAHHHGNINTTIVFRTTLSDDELAVG
jgi:hypothetical protein